VFPFFYFIAVGVGFIHMEKLILRYVHQNICFAKTGALLLAVVLFALPAKLVAQADTSKKLKQVNIQTNPIPQVQTITPSQQVTNADFTRYSALTVADAIRDFAGINIKDYGGIGGLKTVSVRSLGANHLAVLYDGVELSDVQNGQIDLGKLNLNNIQSITLYNAMPPQICQPARSFASASVLAITTLKPKLDSIKPYQISLGVNGGSFGLINPYLQWQQRISNRWSFVVNGYVEHASGRYKFKNNDDGSDTLANRINGDVSVQQTDAALYWAKTDSNKFNMHVNFYNSDRGLPPAVVSYNPYSAARSRNQDFFMQAGYERVWQNGFHLLINSKYSQDYLRYTDPNYLNNAGGLDQQYTQREFYQSATVAYSLTGNWQVSYAIDAAYAKLDANLDKYLYPNRFTLLNVLASSLTAGKWFFEGSLLQTNASDRVNKGDVAAPVSVLSPTLVVNYRANQNLQLRAFYKDIFRQPTFDEQYFFAVLQTRNIKPEYAKQFDAGLTYSKSLNGLFNYVALTADAYFNRVTNKIISLPSQNVAISSVLNLGRVDIKGVDVGLKTHLSLNAGWQGVFGGSYTYQQALNQTNADNVTEIPYTPQNSFAVNAGAYNKHWGFYYNQVYSSSRYYINDNSPEYNIPGFAVGDITGVYKFGVKTKPVTISAALNNVFNTRYEIVRSFPMPGRSIRLSMQITI
jgi:vitamin B12 transporter